MIRLGGIKFSEELAQITVNGSSSSGIQIHGLLSGIAVEKINIPFFCLSNDVEIKQCSAIFCVERSEFDTVQQLLPRLSLPDRSWSVIQSVGTITLFPHRNSFSILGKTLAIFGKYRYPVHSLSTSISALAVNTDFSLLDEIAENLQESFELPENHAPFRPQFLLKEM
jgi:hypothetical protein